MTTVDLKVLAANLPAFIDKASAGETIIIASNHRPLAELRPPSAANSMLDEQEIARRNDLLRRMDELRAEITRESGVNPDSTPLFREMRDNE